MDTNLNLQTAIVALLEEYQAYLSNSNIAGKDDRLKVVVDTQHNHYQLLISGWKNQKYNFKVLFHLDIINDKIWIQQNDTEFAIGDELIDKGVNKQSIVLGFLPERDRIYSGFAVI